MDFLSDGYLLESGTAQVLYEDIADLPIVDPHSHADVVEIVENNGWSDIWEVEGATDHYIWALMRNRGVPEEKITGDAPNREKWNALAAVFPKFAGNPTYEWVHLDLKRRFGIDQPISAETADEIWERTAVQLEEEAMCPQSLLREMDVEVVCSTDDPTSQLEYHERAEKEVANVDVLPTWRADRALQTSQPDWREFVDDLAEATGIDTRNLDGYLNALRASHDHFADYGCMASDIGIQMPVSRSVDDTRAQKLYETALTGSIGDREARELQAYLLEHIGELNAEKDWTTQFHIGPVRNYRTELHESLGPATGGDISTQDISPEEDLRYFLNHFDGELDIVLYCLDPTHYPTITTLARVFPNVNVGPAWWFNDSPFGIEQQFRYVGSVELLANAPGMVSDSRKLLSYGSRFEMFRRTLANVVGTQVKRGRMPMGVARDLVTDVAYDRPRELYGF